MNIIESLKDSYKKSPVKVIAVSLFILVGLMFAWYITVPLAIAVYFGKKFKKEEHDKKDTKKKCPHCQTEIDWLATRCPNCHGKMHVWTADRKIIALVIVMLFFIGVVKMSSSSPSTSSVSSIPSTPSPEQAKKDREIMSIVFAKSVIEKTLKAPSTAKFVDVQAYELSNLKDVWAVNGYVDSQNSFGAMIRSQWEVQLDYRDGKGGSVKSVLFDGKKIL
ncbi:hypothetical protein KKG24_02500 [Patescibacteria group bacterium]|nr:hypothetical protein [Patescibacteria group bacterium]